MNPDYSLDYTTIPMRQAHLQPIVMSASPERKPSCEINLENKKSFWFTMSLILILCFALTAFVGFKWIVDGTRGGNSLAPEQSMMALGLILFSVLGGVIFTAVLAWASKPSYRE